MNIFEIHDQVDAICVFLDGVYKADPKAAEIQARGMAAKILDAARADGHGGCPLCGS